MPDRVDADRGALIALEGIDGSGKTTIGQRLATSVRHAGYDVVLTREPGGTVAGENIRQMLLESGSHAITPRTEALLFAAARAQHVSEIIAPALERGAVVIVDRFIDSSLAYQWGGRGLERDSVEAIQRFATGGLTPDLRLLFDLPVAQALLRRHAAEAGTNRLDHETAEFFERVRAAYLTLQEEDLTTWRIIDATRCPEEVWQQVVSVVNRSSVLPRPID